MPCLSMYNSAGAQAAAAAAKEAEVIDLEVAPAPASAHHSAAGVVALCLSYAVAML